MCIRDSYKGYVAFTNFEIGVSDRVTELEEKADFERQGEVIALMMYLNDPPELKEHLLMPSISECLKRKRISMRSTNNAQFQCMKVNAVVKDGKIISISKSD